MSLCHDPVPIFDGFYVLTNQTKMAASSNVIEFHFLFKVLYQFTSYKVLQVQYVFMKENWLF